MPSLMLWKLIWTSNQIQSHRTSSQTRRRILIPSLIYLLHQVVTRQSQQIGNRMMNWDCRPCRTRQFAREINKKKLWCRFDLVVNGRHFVYACINSLYLA